MRVSTGLSVSFFKLVIAVNPFSQLFWFSASFWGVWGHFHEVPRGAGCDAGWREALSKARSTAVWIPGQISLRFDLGTCFGASLNPSDMGMLLLQVSCLCGSAPCLLCGCCPSAKNSTISRLLFTFFLFLGTLVSIIMIIPGVEKELRKVKNSRGSLGLIAMGKRFSLWSVWEAESEGEFWGHDVASVPFFLSTSLGEGVINPSFQWRGQCSGIISCII